MRRQYTVDDVRATRDGWEWSVATDSEEDPAILVVEDGEGKRRYLYAVTYTETTLAHKRRAAAAVAAWKRRESTVP